MLDEDQINERIQGLRGVLESNAMGDEFRAQIEALVVDFEVLLASSKTKEM